MSLRVSQKELQHVDRALTGGWVNPDRLAEQIRQANQPVPLQELARHAVRSHWVDDRTHRIYAPGRAFRVGERVRLLDGRLGDVVALGEGSNDIQGAFKVLTVHLSHREKVQLAAEVPGALRDAEPDAVFDDAVEQVLAEQGSDVIRDVRQTLASDPRFITLYYRNGEYGCLREFFPPMSPDVLDAAVAVLLDAFFDQIAVSRVTATDDEEAGALSLHNRSRSVEALFATDPFEEAISAFPEARQAEETVRRQFDTVRSIWLNAEAHGVSWSAARLAHNFVQPLLRSLGWSSVPLSTLGPAAGGVYALCIDDTAAAELCMDDGIDRPFARRAPVLVEVVSYGRSLDGVLLHTETDRLAGQDTPDAALGPGSTAPGHGLVGEMRRTGVRWGILTNGRAWRLFCRDANSLTRTFYELELPSVFAGLAEGDRPGLEQWQAFQRWWLLFRKSSYTVGSDGRCLVERLRLRIPRDEVRTRELLRERLLGEALPAIAGGFLAYRRQRLGIGQESPATLREVHRSSVLLATRLMLTLVAEARGLLPLNDPGYHPHSLTVQAQTAVERLSRGLPFSSGVYTTPRYDLVVALFQRLSRGDAEKGVPAYGKQFYDPADCPDHAFLDRVRLSDQAIARALDALARSVDYTAVDARDLISICSEMVGTRLSLVDVEAGKVIITREGTERLGARNLPDYVATTSAEQAIAPVVEQRSGIFWAAMERVVTLRRGLRRALDRRRRAMLYAEWEQAAREAREAFLSIRVCDPAMGAGAFLLASADALTDAIVAALQTYHTSHRDVPREWNPIYKLIDDVRRDGVEESARQGLGAEVVLPDDATILCRLIVEHCLFGVAPDPIAVEVAKAALWLHSFIPQMPLSYLDHHLRVGNAILGADLPQVAEALGVADLPQQIAACATELRPLSERIDTTALDVQWSSSQAAKADEALRPYRLLADMVVSASLGDAEASGALQVLRSEGGARWPERILELAPAWLSAQAEAEGFFHWELAFPEVRMVWAKDTWNSEAGFDLVIGNPPWLATPEDAVVRYLAERFAGCGTGADACHAYLGMAHKLLPATGGRTYFVLSREWLTSPTGAIS